MPADLLSDPTGIVCLFSDGRRMRRVVVGEPAGLVADLLTGLTWLVHPHGRVDSPGTVNVYLKGVRDMAAFAGGRGVSGGAGDLGRGVLAEYWMQSNRVLELTTRRMLAAADAAADGRLLQPGVRDLVGGRHFTRRRKESPLIPYTQAEWQHLHEVVRGIVDTAYVAHRQALASAGRGQDPREHGWNADNQAWLLMRLGPCSDRQVGDYLGEHEWWVRTRGGVRSTGDDLFPDVNVVTAYRLLLGMYCGIVPDGLADLGVSDLDWAGQTTILLSYVKGRTAAESLTLPRRAVRLLEQWLDHSTMTRRHAPAGQREHLWLYYAYSGPSRWQPGPNAQGQVRWARHHGLPGVDRRRVRTTYLSLRERRSWQGSPRSTIDPNHSPAVEGDHYLSAVTAGQQNAIEGIIEGAQRDMLARARPPVVLPDDAAADLAQGYPHLVAGLSLDDEAIIELVGGARDVFVAACTDPLSGLHGPAGKPCPARPWVCLLCPLAVFTPRHAPNLLRLKAFFSRQWDQMPAAHFMAVFGPYATAVTAVLDRYDITVLATANQALTDQGDDTALPLRPEETTK
jgi:hypothetical protein